MNETGYITKSVHFWNHDAFARDFFCNTGDAQFIYFGAMGWLAKLGLSFDQIAWTGRIITWLLLAIAWRGLSFTVVPRAWVAVATAQIFVLLSEQAHMAGEWIVGGVEAKGFAWAFVLFALTQLVRGRWNLAWVLLGVAALFHIVVGGWAAICLGAVWLISSNERPGLPSMLPGLIVSFLLALPGLYFACRLQADVSWATAIAADRIQVFERLPHHLLPTMFATGYVPRQLLEWALFIVLCTQVRATSGDRRLRRFVAATLALSIVGFILGWIAAPAPDAAALVLRFYWFRMSDILVPCAVALIGLQFLLNLIAEGKRTALWLGTLLLAVCVFDLYNQARHFPWLPKSWGEVTPRSDKFLNYNDWLNVCRWVVEHTPPDAAFITPRNSATFKWNTARNEVGTWKDMPQDAAGVVEWRERMQNLFASNSPTAAKPWRTSVAEADAEGMRKLAAQYGAGYAIVDISPDAPLPNLEPVFKNDSFVVYQFASP